MMWKQTISKDYCKPVLTFKETLQLTDRHGWQSNRVAVTQRNIVQDFGLKKLGQKCLKYSYFATILSVICVQMSSINLSLTSLILCPC